MLRFIEYILTIYYELFIGSSFSELSVGLSGDYFPIELNIYEAFGQGNLEYYVYNDLCFYLAMLCTIITLILLLYMVYKICKLIICRIANV